MSALDKLTKEDVAALRQFAIACNCGIRWKGELRASWESGVWGYKVEPDTRATLRNIRNRLGTSWLSKFNFA